MVLGLGVGLSKTNFGGKAPGRAVLKGRQGASYTWAISSDRRIYAATC